MLESVNQLFNTLGSFVWGPPMLILLVGTGIYLTFLLRGMQFHKLGYALRLAFRRQDETAEGDISHFQALMTAMAATVGTGNIAGVATAIALGGPGAVFWMWITGLFGMATKYAEAVLAVCYREKDPRGQMCGGPMYYLEKGLGQKWLGVLFAIFAVCASFGIGSMVQSNSVASALGDVAGIPHWTVGLVLAVLTGLVTMGGIRSIGRVTAVMVPLMILFYVGSSLYILAMYITEIPSMIAFIVTDAFTPTSAAGGFAGATVMQAMRYGVARGVFSNESGLGSAPIAAAAARTRNPVTQALISMTQTFIDTIVVCTMTALVIIATGVWTTGSSGAELTTRAYSMALPGTVGGLLVSLSLMFFAYSTILGWSYYGEKSLEYLMGWRAVPRYRVLFCLAVFLGAVLELELVWNISDVFNGLMAVPNLIGLLGLSGIVYRETRKYFDELDPAKP